MSAAPYSRVIARRAWALGLGLAALLALATWWQQRQASPAGETIFRPARRIEEVLSAGNAMQATAPTPATDPALVVSSPCEGRQAELLRTRTMASLEIDAPTAQARLAAAAQAMGGRIDCTRFAQSVRLALSLGQQGDAAGAPWSAAAVERRLIEDVTWTRRVPCLYSRDKGLTLVLAGPASRCAIEGGLGSLGSRPRESSFRQQASAIAQAMSAAGASGKLPALEGMWLTLDSDLQDRLDQLQPCRRQPGCRQWPELAGLQDVSVVVMDVRSGALLAAWCDGPSCERAARAGGGALPAALMEAPPASSAKLLFSLGLASLSSVDPLMLQRQIKTSGQMDNQVTKRNEWWERQAICDGRAGEPCLIPTRTRRIAEALGWNAQCVVGVPGGGLRCGRWGLISPLAPDLVAGQVGRLALPAASTARARMLDWVTYDEVRRGQRPPKGLAGFSEASRSVQAVLGAGDSRTSALGLAVLPMQIWRLAHGFEPARPHLVQPQPDTDLSLPAGLDLQSAAQVVLAGMRKAVEPAEAGWQGAGTVAPAFARELGRPCTGDCGIWAKTGTVSQQDRGFRGTTVLSALVDTAELARWSGQALPPGSQERILSIGIIAQPQGSAARTHAASHLGMGLLRHLTLPASPP